MRHVAESFAWCVLQVTLFTLVASGVYGIAQRLRPGRNGTLLVASLAVVGALTLMAGSPWPSWNAQSEEVRASDTQVDGTRPSSDARDAVADTVTPIQLPELGIENGLAPLGSLEVPAAEAASPASWFLLVWVAWAFAGVGLVRAVVGLAYLRRYVRLSTPIEDDIGKQILRELCQKFGIRRSVELRESFELGGAATFGWRRPIVLLPTSWRGWSPDELRAVLAHELAHVRQRHFLAWLMSQAVVVVHFYHPAVHWLARRLRLEQEIDADRLAASVFGDRRQYATILAGLALGLAPPRAAFSGVGLFMSRPLLMRRIAMLRQSRDSVRGASRVARGGLIALILLAAVGVAGFRNPRSAVAEPTPQPPDATSGAVAAPPVTAPATPAPARQSGVLPMIWAEENRAGQVTAVSLIRVARQPAAMLATADSRPLSAGAWQIYCKTQVALLKSYFVLSRAIRAPEIASLPIIEAQDSPVEWLQRNLEVFFYPNTEILSVQMRVPKDDAEQARHLVDSVVDAYMQEVVHAEQQRVLSSRDALANSYEKLNDELNRKMEEYYDLVRESGVAEDGGSGQLMQQLDMRRLDRVETELMRLEDELLRANVSGEDEKTKIAYYEQRIVQLRERQEELEKNLRARSERSVDLWARKRQLEQLQSIAAEMSRKLEVMDVNISAPSSNDGIQLIQRAVLSGSEAAPDAARR